MESLNATSRSYFGGYGSGKLDCNAALAILGILGLIEILRDLIDEVTHPATGKKRSISYLGGSQKAILTSIRNEIPRDLEDVFPGVILPLLHSLVDINDEILPSTCVEITFCEANFALVQPFNFNGTSATSTSTNREELKGLKGNIRWQVAKYLSDILANSFINSGGRRLIAAALEAAEAGRRGVNCRRSYPECELRAPYKPQPGFRMTHLKTYW